MKAESGDIQRILTHQKRKAHLMKKSTFNEDKFSPMVVEDTEYTEKKDAGAAILAACEAMTTPDPKYIGRYRGFDMELFFDKFEKQFCITLAGSLRHTVALGTDIYGNIARIDNLIASFPDKLKQEEELREKTARLDKLNILLNMDHKENEIADGEVSDDIPAETDKAIVR